MIEGTLDGVENLTLTDKIYQLLKENIVRHRLEPGARLLDQEIADSLNVSRTPVREALNRLGAEGLVDIVPRRGAFVVNLSDKDIKDVYEVREVLEILAIRLALPRMTDKDLAVLDEILEECATALERQDYLVCFELDRKFHDEIVRMSGNAKLAEVNTLLGGNIQTTRWRHCQDGHRQQISLQEHRGILDALKKRDADRAAEFVSHHINSVKRDLLTEQQPDP
jgi:DNA-binding GntR family transcriptional regulator